MFNCPSASAAFRCQVADAPDNVRRQQRVCCDAIGRLQEANVQRDQAGRVAAPGIRRFIRLRPLGTATIVGGTAPHLILAPQPEYGWLIQALPDGSAWVIIVSA
jgi:hypothetical protein